MSSGAMYKRVIDMSKRSVLSKDEAKPLHCIASYSLPVKCQCLSRKKTNRRIVNLFLFYILSCVLLHADNGRQTEELELKFRIIHHKKSWFLISC